MTPVRSSRASHVFVSQLSACCIDKTPRFEIGITMCIFLLYGRKALNRQCLPWPSCLHQRVNCAAERFVELCNTL
jgi:hypothetical protein